MFRAFDAGVSIYNASAATWGATRPPLADYSQGSIGVSWDATRIAIGDPHADPASGVNAGAVKVSASRGQWAACSGWTGVAWHVSLSYKEFVRKEFVLKLVRAYTFLVAVPLF